MEGIEQKPNEAPKAKEIKSSAPASFKKSESQLKTTDTVIVSFKNPVHVTEDGENKIDTERIVQHVKFAFWEGLRKDSKGNVLHSTMRGAKLIGYVQDEEEILF